MSSHRVMVLGFNTLARKGLKFSPTTSKDVFHSALTVVALWSTAGLDIPSDALALRWHTPCLHANPAAAVARVHFVSVLTRSRLSRSVQPAKSLRCGLRRRPCALRFSPGFCGGTAQQGAVYQRGECICPALSWVTACR